MRKPWSLVIKILISKACQSGFAMTNGLWIWSASATKGAGMATIAASVGKQSETQGFNPVVQFQIRDSLFRLSAWLEVNDYRGYDTFDGLSSRYARPFTFGNK